MIQDLVSSGSSLQNRTISVLVYISNGRNQIAKMIKSN